MGGKPEKSGGGGKIARSRKKRDPGQKCFAGYRELSFFPGTNHHPRGVKKDQRTAKREETDGSINVIGNRKTIPKMRNRVL